MERITSILQTSWRHRTQCYHAIVIESTQLDVTVKNGITHEKMNTCDSTRLDSTRVTISDAAYVIALLFQLCHLVACILLFGSYKIVSNYSKDPTIEGFILVRF